MAPKGAPRGSRARHALWPLLLLLVPLAVLLALRARIPQAPAAVRPPETAPVPVEPTAAPPEDPTPEVRGHILDADGNPVGDAEVRLVAPAPPWTVLRDARSDAAGAFSFAHLPLQRVHVAADHDPGGAETSADLIPAAGRSLDVTLVLSPAAAVRGQVVDGDGKPLKDATITVDGVPWPVASASSDVAGAFRLAVVPREAASVAASLPGYRTASVPIAGRDETTELSVRLRLVAASPVDGEVRDSDGHPIAAHVVACQGRGAGIGVTSGEDGRFQLAAAAIGCDAFAEHTGFAPSSPVRVEEGTLLALRLPRGGTIVGRVTDDRQFSLAGVEIGFDAVQGPAFSAVVHSDASGQYTLEGAPAGLLTLRARKDGYRMRLISGLRIAPAGSLRQDIVLTAVNGGAGLELGGIGAALRQVDGAIALGEVFPGDPAERAGLRGGDRIVSIDGEATQGMTMADALQRLRGEPGTSVFVSAQRPDTGETVEVTVVRATIVH